MSRIAIGAIAAVSIIGLAVYVARGRVQVGPAEIDLPDQSSSDNRNSVGGQLMDPASQNGSMTASIEGTDDSNPNTTAAEPTGSYNTDRQSINSPTEQAHVDEVEMLAKERNRLKALLLEVSQPLLRAKVDNGTAEYVGASHEYKLSMADNALVCAVFMMPDGGTYKSVISRSERPDLYVLKDQILELGGTIEAMEHERAMAASVSSRAKEENK